MFSGTISVMLFPLAIILSVLFFIRYLQKNDRGTIEPKKALWGVAVLGVAALIGSVILESLLIPSSWLPDLTDESVGTSLPLLQVAFGATLVGIIEELAKFIPVALLVYKKPYFNEIADGVIYFGVAALVFGAVEDFGYGLIYGNASILRLVTGPFLHVGFGVLAGMALARYKVLRTRLSSVIIALLAAIMLHATYDFALYSNIPLLILLALAISLVLNIGIFKHFRRAQKTDMLLDSSVTLAGIASAKNASSSQQK